MTGLEALGNLLHQAFMSAESDKQLKLNKKNKLKGIKK